MAKEKISKLLKTGNLLDYIGWRGDLSFRRDYWNVIDSLIAASLSYINFGENELTLTSGRSLYLSELNADALYAQYPPVGLKNEIKERRDMLELLTASRRFRSVRILDQVNDVDIERNIQFSALTMEVPDVGIVVAFRGTDPTVVAWKEDFMMSYLTPVPAQSAAVAYLRRIAESCPGPLRLAGHSKGGNLSVYAGVYSDPEIRERIQSICSFDGPGLDDDTMESDAYREIAPRVTSIIPSDSIVGRLMNYHPVYQVVSSTRSSFFQHDPFSWNLLGSRFDMVDDISLTSQILDKTLHDWIKSCSPEQRENFVSVVFGFLERNQKSAADLTFSEDAVDGSDKLDDRSRQMVVALLYRLISMQVGNVVDARIRNPLIQAAASLRSRDGIGRDVVVKSPPIEIDNVGNGYQAAVEETRKMAEFNELTPRESLRLQLFTEEMLSMAHTVTGEMKAEFWIECTASRFDLHLSTKTIMDRKKRELLLAASASGKNEAARSFLGRLRNAFEQAMVSDAEKTVFKLPTKSDNNKQGWDHFEQSVLLRLADDVKIDIRGGLVNMTVCKSFSH